MIALLKSDRFGMEITFKIFLVIPLPIDVKIRPFRYGNTKIFKNKLKLQLLVKIRPFRYGNFLPPFFVFFLFWVKIRPFRYGNVRGWLTPIAGMVKVKIRPFRYGNTLSTMNLIT